MLRKTSLILCAAVVLVAALAPAAAASRGYFGQVIQTGDLGTNVWQRYYNPLYNGTGAGQIMSPLGEAACVPTQAIVGFDVATRSCQLKYRTLALGGYKGYPEDIFNETANNGEVRIALFDYEAAGSTAQHIGYYVAEAKAVADSDPAVGGNWTADCAGTSAQTCLGSAQTSNNGGTTTPSPMGDLAPIGGFRPIPVPAVTGVVKATGDINLSWTPASFIGSGAISYDLYGVDKSTCDAPLPGEYTRLIGNFTGTATTVNVSAFGHGPNDPFCYYFALKLSYPPANGTHVTSRFFSGNSQGAALGGMAAEITNLRAKISNRQKGVVVSWTTSLEESVRSFSIMRSTDGRTFSQVGQQSANNAPSSYVFLDQTASIHGRTTIYYKLVVNQDSGATTAYGPVQATRGGRE